MPVVAEILSLYYEIKEHVSASFLLSSQASIILNLAVATSKLWLPNLSNLSLKFFLLWYQSAGIV
jgi:hypothetical protein